VLFVVGANFGASKLWPPERFAAVARHFQQCGYRSLITVGPAEVDLGRRIAADAGVQGLFDPVLPLDQLIAVVARCALMVTGATINTSGRLVVEAEVAPHRPDVGGRLPLGEDHRDPVEQRRARAAHRSHHPEHRPSCRRQLPVSAGSSLSCSARIAGHDGRRARGSYGDTPRPAGSSFCPDRASHTGRASSVSPSG